VAVCEFQAESIVGGVVPSEWPEGGAMRQDLPYGSIASATPLPLGVPPLPPYSGIAVRTLTYAGV
jgi:hypothetical protein